MVIGTVACSLAVIFAAALLVQGTEAQVCYQLSSYSSAYFTYYQQLTYTSERYTTACGFLWLSRCNRYRSVSRYRSTPQTNYQTVYQSIPICCSGYSGSPPSNCQPVCTPSCLHGTCTSPSMCSCNAGWTGGACSEDINECGTNNGGCEQTCNNTVGSYYCSCGAGYVLNSDDHNCTDINECANNNGGCAQTCTNTAGSYQCSCGPGYTLNNDGHTCDDINECVLGTNNCNQNCNNTIGSYYCSCDPGYHLLNHPHICSDVDECSNGSLHMCTQHCNNTMGSHHCDCYAGYELQPDGFTCTDIDECVLGISGCDHNCTNNIGSFQCSCVIGYQLIYERNCIDINECDTINGGCEHVCNNQIGSYHCTCRPGYTLESDLSNCSADPCPLLFNPINGAIMCTGPQVTDENCNYTCQTGYNLTGSVMRTCQPDHTWTGDPTSCPPKQCVELVGQNHAFVVTPCGQDFNTSCNVLCEHGYYINGTTDGWRQTCQLNEELDVEWSDPPVCVELKPCDNSPCLNGGTCIVTDTQTELCVCPALFHGSECQTSFINIPPIPVLFVGVPSANAKLLANATEGFLDVFPVVLPNTFNSVIRFGPSESFRVKQSSSGATFTITAEQQGLFKIKYISSGTATESTFYEIFEDSLVTVVDSNRPSSRQPYAYFTTGNLNRGFLGVGCCHYAYPLPGAFCASSLQLISSCSWSDDQGITSTATTSTAGVVFLKASNLNLPLSIAGVQAQSGNTFELTVPIQQGGHTPTCSQCTQCNNCDTGNTTVCYEIDRNVPFDQYDISDMLREQSLFRTFLANSHDLLPSWLSAIIDTATTSYSQYDYHASIMQYNEAVTHPGCNHISLDNTGLLYVFKTQNSLRLNIAGQTLRLLPGKVAPLCFVVDVCSGNRLKMEVVLQDRLSPLLNTLNYFSSLSSIGWTFDPQSVVFSDLGVTGAISDSIFWNGETSIIAKLPSYDFKMKVLVKGNLTGGNLVASHLFESSTVFHKSVTKDNEVPGQLFGTGNVELAVSYGSSRDVLYLRMVDQSALFAIPDTTAAVTSAVQSGIAYHTTYQLVPREDAAFFSSLFAIPDYTQSCPVKLYIRLTNSFEISWASFRTTCLGVRMNMLEFSSNLKHTVSISGLSAPSSMHSTATTPRLSIRSILTGTSLLQLNNFFTLLASASGIPSIEMTYSGSYPLPTATLYNTNITVFDNVVNADVSIEENVMQFTGQTTIFGSYLTTVKGVSTTAKKWSTLPLRYEGTLDGIYVSQLNTYLITYITDEVNDIKTRRQNAHDSLNNAEQQLLLVLKKHNSKSMEHQAANMELENLNAAADSLALQVNQSKQAYEDSLAMQQEAQQAASSCTEQECKFVCQFGVSCTTCYINTRISHSGSCLTYETAHVKVLMSRPVPEEFWGYKRVCTPCGWWARIGFFCFSSRRLCCSVQCIRMYRFREQLYYGLAPRTVSKLVPCQVTEIDTSIASQCCMQYQCAYTIRDPTCVNSNMVCAQQKQAALAALGSSGAAVTATYAIYTQLKASHTIAELQVSAKQAEIAGIEQEINIIESALESARLGYNISLNDFKTVQEQTADDLPLVHQFDAYGVTQLLQVQSASYNVTVTTGTPIAFPVILTYTKPYAGQSDQLTTVINFEAPEGLTRRRIAEDLISQFNEGGSRRKRQAGDTGSNLVSTFQKSCTDLMNMQDYFDQLLTAVNRTQAQTDAANVVIFNVTDMTASTFSSFNSSSMMNVNSTNATVGSSSFNSSVEAVAMMAGFTAMAALQNLSLQREEAAFLEWQTSLGLLHNGTSAVGGYECFGFGDCLHMAVTVLQRILSDTPGDEARELLKDLKIIKNEVEQLGVYKNLTLDDADSRLQQVADIMDRLNDIEYWCAGLPEFTKNPTAEVNISVSKTLSLVTSVQSDLPVSYRWRRNGVLLSGQQSSTLTLSNIQMVDSGKYECLATTDKGTVTSLPSTVNVYYAPVFNMTLTSSVVREGNENGVNFACDAHSWPPPIWTWYTRPNASIEWQQIPELDSNFLPLLSPRLDQEGWYRCTASNWIGQDSRDAFLTVLHSTVVRINYPLSMRLVETDEEGMVGPPEGEITTSASGKPEEMEPTFGDSLNHSLSVQLMLVTTQVEDAVYRKQDQELELSFNFITPDFKLDSLADMTVEGVLQLAGPAMMNLETDKARLQTVMEETGLHVDHDSTRYRSVNDSLSVGTRTFLCPDGYGLDPSLVICEHCAPGSYNGPPKISMTDVGGGQFIQEAMAQCLECPMGTYQHVKGSTECVQCPRYTSTLSPGADGASNCIDFCQAGYFSSNGLLPCQPCAPNYYQLERGATDCLSCTNTTSPEICPRPYPSITPSPTPLDEPEEPVDNNIIIIIATSASGGVLAVTVVLTVVVVIIVIIVRKRKTKYNVQQPKGDQGITLCNVGDGAANLNVYRPSLVQVNNPVYQYACQPEQTCAEVKTTSSSCYACVPQPQNKYVTMIPRNEVITTCTSDDDDGKESLTATDNDHTYEEITDEM